MRSSEADADQPDAPGRRDVMSAEKRSRLMSRIRGKDTGPERIVAALLTSHRFRFEQHARDLPGRPDFVFRSRRLVILVDGDFWHGWRFPAWRDKLSPFWRAKIAANRARDERNIRKLRRSGWMVVRVWEHQLDRSPQAVRDRLVGTLRARPPTRVGPCAR